MDSKAVNGSQDATVSPLLTQQSSNHPRNSRRTLIIVVILLFLLVSVSIYLYFNKKHTVTQLQTTQVTPTSSALPTPIAVIDNNTRIVFEKELSSPGTINSEIWIMNTNGSNASKLNLPQSNPRPLNSISDGWVYYLSPTNPHTNTGNSLTIYAYNYLSNQNKSITETAPANTAVTIFNYFVSTDGEKIIYSLGYTQLVNGSAVCGQEPCPNADPYPTYKTGMYSYDIETGKKVYLGSAVGINDWENNNIFFTTNGSNYHEFNLSAGTYKEDTNTGVVTMIDSQSTPSNDFGYMVYPITDTEKIVIDSLKNSQGGASINGDIKVVKDNHETIIDSSDNICNFNACVKFSPNRKFALYGISNGSSLGDYYTTNLKLLDLTTLNVKSILQTQDGQSLNLAGAAWVSNTQIVIEIAQGLYPNDKRNLSLLDVTTRTLTPLTTSNNIRTY